MKNCSTVPILFYVFLCFVFMYNTSIAQTIEANAYRSKANSMYWQNKKPHAAYWQQDVAYTIDAFINEKKNTIEGHEVLNYWNNSPDTLYFVYFHLYQNAFIKGSYLEELHKVNKQPVKRMGAYQQNGLGTIINDLKANQIKCKTELDNTILKVYLPTPLMPGESSTFDMHFITFFDRGDFRRRMSMYPSWGFMHYNGVHWYPRISVYDMKKGWDTDQHLNKELYGDFGIFDIKLNFAHNYVVEATGELQNPDEVYPGNLRAQLDVKQFAKKAWNEAPSIITPYDSTQRKIWHYIANNVHDVAFTADPSYRISETILQPTDKNAKPIQCIGLVSEPHASKWQNSSALVAKFIQIYSTDFGQYEYPKMVAADANDGMEYPMLTLDGGADPDYRGVFAHEIGHNWFYGMIGNNETYRAALDEGFTQFLTAWGLTKLDGETAFKSKDKNKYKRRHRLPELNRDRSVYNRYINDAVRGIDKPLNTHSNDFNSAIGHENGYSNVYHKTATMLYNLQYVLGDDLFLQAIKHYVAKWKMAHPYFEDFRQSIIEYTHQDLNWFFDQWMETSKTIDYSILSIKKTHKVNEFNIKLKRKGEMQMPIDLSVVARDNKVYNYTIPNNVFTKQTKNILLKKWYGWDLLYPRYTAKLNIPSGIRRVEIDPSHRLADIDMCNNYKRPGHLIAPESIDLRFDYLINNPANRLKYNAFWRPDIWWNPIDGLKLGLHLDGHYLNFLRKLYTTVWFNTRILSAVKYRAFEGEGWWKNASIIDYTFRYESPLKAMNKRISVGLETRSIDAYKKHSIYSNFNINKNNTLRIEGTSLYRSSKATNAYLFAPEEWSSYVGRNGRSTKENTYLQLQFQHDYRALFGNGLMKITMRTPFSYDYSYLQGEWINRKNWKKFEISGRAFARFGFGKDIPTESALYMQGANPEELMENKFTRTQGILPASLGDYSTTSFSNIHGGGGLNLRAYTGYYAIDENAQGIIYSNYKGTGGASLNLEIEFDKYLRFQPRRIKDYLHLDAYLFGDAGLMRRSAFDINTITQLNPIAQWSKLRADAGIGTALTLKKFGPFEKINPLIIRVDFPFFISAPPASNPSYIDFRWILGVSRAF